MYMFRTVQKLTKNKFKTLMESVDCILVDCDGVLYRGNVIIKGTPEVIGKLKQLGKKVYFLSNNATKSRKEFAENCRSMGFTVEDDDIINSSYVSSCYLAGLNMFGDVKLGKVFCLGSPSLTSQLESMGVPIYKQILPAGGNDLETASMSALDKEVGCVLVSLDERLTYLKLAMASRYLSNPECLFGATNMDSTLPVSSGVILPGSCVAMLTSATGRKPDFVCGKPSSIVFEVVRTQLGINPKKTLVIGDRLDTDIAFANGCHLKSILVLTGVSTIEQANKAIRDQRPNFYLPSLADMLELL